MLITELKNQIEAGKKIDELIEFKQYNSVVEKHLIATKIIDSCIIEDSNGLSRIDYFYKNITTNVSLIVNYTNLEFSDELINDYDYLCEFVGIEWIIDKISPIEVYFIQELVDEELDQMIKINNGVENILASKLEKAISKIPDSKELKKLMVEAKKQINGIKPENVAIFKDILQKQGGIN